MSTISVGRYNLSTLKDGNKRMVDLSINDSIPEHKGEGMLIEEQEFISLLDELWSDF